MSSYPSTTLVVYVVRRAFAGRGGRPYLCQVDCMTTGALHTCIRPIARVGSVTSAGQLSEEDLDGLSAFQMWMVASFPAHPPLPVAVILYLCSCLLHSLLRGISLSVPLNVCFTRPRLLVSLVRPLMPLIRKQVGERVTLQTATSRKLLFCSKFVENAPSNIEVSLIAKKSSWHRCSSL
ncbi:hypothetical protein BHM03_00041467 [Ensete ventricosum]|nr:hypothetical protein BHM03_00041467 [Ensete ventricosum]